ncbi:MAG: helix-turn-helix domain-containing protein [Oleiphilaceae bacterium]|nr:helix-turn-helix domain-containing protein [Oleiphilaceae bacterium]
MPSNRRTQPQAEKRAELIAAARELFIGEGYDATPMNRIARQAGVTPNTIYWYFKDKDQLLLAVLDDILQEDLAAYAEVAQAPLVDRMMWLVERLRPIRGLVVTVHNRIRVSPGIDAWHTGLHTLLEQLFTDQLPAPLPSHTRDADIRIITFTLEGMISHEVDPVATRQTCEALVARLLPST